MSDLENFKHLLTLEIINSAFVFAIEIMISFLNSSLVIILILGFLLPSPLFFTFNIFPTSLAEKEGNASLTHKTSSILHEMFDFKAYTYNFFIFEGFGTFLMTVSTLLFKEVGTISFIVGGGGTANLGRDTVEFKEVGFSFEFADLDDIASIFL